MASIVKPVFNILNNLNSFNGMRGQLFGQGVRGLHIPTNLNLGKYGNSFVSTAERDKSMLTARSSQQSWRNVSVDRAVTQKGNAVEVATKQNIQDGLEASKRSVLSQQTETLTKGNEKGKQVTLKTEKDLLQVSDEARKYTSAENRTGTETIIRTVAKDGNVSLSKTNIDTSNQGNQDVDNQINRRTETQVRLKTYDQNGAIKSDKFSDQVVTVDQDTSVARTWQGEGTRDIGQKTTVDETKVGGATFRNIQTETSDISQGKQVYNTGTNTRTVTQVENLDAGGNVLSSKSATQQVVSNDIRTVDTNRETETDQSTFTVSRAGLSQSYANGSYETSAKTVDHTSTNGTVQNFNGQGNLVGERNFANEVTSTTTEQRQGANQSMTSVIKENGSTITSTQMDSRQDAEVNTSIVSNQDGKVTERNINTETAVNTWGGLVNQVNAKGERTVEVGTGQISQTETKDLTVGPNGQGRLTETETISGQIVEGGMQFNPATNQVTTGQKVAPGSVVVDFGAYTGIQTSFKLDNGTLEFDFSAKKLSYSDQETRTGEVTQGFWGPSVKGPGTEQEKLVEEDIHFKGKITSSVDANGDRVLTLEGKITDEGTGALLVNNGQGFQGEQSRAELNINGKLSVNRQTTVEGNATNTQVKADAQLDVNRVATSEDVGVNVSSLTPLGTADSAKIGLTSNNGALRFNLGVFNLGISFRA